MKVSILKVVILTFVLYVNAGSAIRDQFSAGFAIGVSKIMLGLGIK